MAYRVQPVYGPDYAQLLMQGLGAYGQVKGIQRAEAQEAREVAAEERRVSDTFAQERAETAAQLRGKSPTEKINILNARISRLTQQGKDPSHTQGLLDMYQQGVQMEGAQSMEEAQMRGKQLTDADAIVEEAYNTGILQGRIKAPEKEKGAWKVLTEQEKQQYNISDPASYQMSPQGQIKKIGGGQVINVNTGQQEDIKVGKIPAGYGLKRNKAGEYEFVTIKGGPAAEKKAQEEEKKVLYREKTGQDADVVLTATKKLIGKLENESIFNPITGPLGGIAENFRGSEAADSEGLRKTIGAGVAFKSLQDMRASNKTGGGLGAISEKEMELLKAAMGSFDKTLSREAQIEALRGLDKIYSKILKKARAYPEAGTYGFGVEAIPVASNTARATTEVNQTQMPPELRERYK
jgi:hypothetical protein